MRPFSFQALVRRSGSRRFRQFAEAFAETDDGIRAITERFIKGPHVGLCGQHLQVQLRAATFGQRVLDMRDQPRADAMTSQRFIHRERIQPAPVPVVAAHHCADDTLAEHRDKEQLRLRRQLVGDRQMRVALRPRHVPVLGECLLPQRDHGVGVARVEAANREGCGRRHTRFSG